MGVHQLRTIIAGSQLELKQSVLLTQIRTKAFRDASCSLGGTTALDLMITDQLQELGWFFGSGVWQHEVLEYTFKMADLVSDKNWQRTAHALRQSFRWKAYQELREVDKREFREMDVPEFSEQRIALAKKWSQMFTGSFGVAIGAIMEDEVHPL